jgi:hypothetical protein
MNSPSETWWKEAGSQKCVCCSACVDRLSTFFSPKETVNQKPLFRSHIFIYYFLYCGLGLTSDGLAVLFFFQFIQMKFTSLVKILHFVKIMSFEMELLITLLMT